VRVTVGDASALAQRALAAEEATVRRLARVDSLTRENGAAAERAAGHAVLSDGTAVSVPLGDLIDLDRECGRLGGELERLTTLIRSQEQKLANQQFVSRAPEAVVTREREKLVQWKEQAAALRQKREQLGCTG
jgi:valyl-tRNA synthetase